jgi:X breakpoint 2-interacting protein
MVSDRSRQRQLGLSVLNALQRAGGKRQLWNQPGSCVEETYRAIVTSYEERQKAILVENGSLRESLSVMQRELVSLLKEQQRTQLKKAVSEEGEEFGGLSSGHFQMPYDIVRDGVERTFRDHLQTLREQLQTATQQQQQQQQQQEEKGEEAEGGEGLDVATLQSKLSDYRDIIGRQEQMLQVRVYHVHIESPVTVPFTRPEVRGTLQHPM